MSSGAGSHRQKVVFVGNIAFDVTEQAVVETLSSVGPVASFRLVFDRDTGKPKGFGFCTYRDAGTAASAVRNLNGHELGGRALRVDFADTESKLDQVAADAPGPLAGAGGALGAAAAAGPLGGQPSANPNQLMLQVLSQLKLLAQSNPEQCKHVLTQNPQLSFALFQAMLLMNVIDQGMLQRVLQSQAGPMQPMANPVTPLPPPGQQLPPPQPMPPQHQMLPPQQSLPPQQQQQQQLQQQQLLQQIMSLTPQQIDALPPQQRDQVLAVRAQMQQQQQPQRMAM